MAKQTTVVIPALLKQPHWAQGINDYLMVGHSDLKIFFDILNNDTINISVFCFLFFPPFYSISLFKAQKYTAVPFNQPNKFGEKQASEVSFHLCFQISKNEVFSPLLLTRLKTTVRYRNPDFKGTLLKLSKHKPLSSFWPWNKKSASRI